MTASIHWTSLCGLNVDPSSSSFSIRNCPFESYHRQKYPVLVACYPEPSQYFTFFLRFFYFRLRLATGQRVLISWQTQAKFKTHSAYRTAKQRKRNGRKTRVYWLLICNCFGLRRVFIKKLRCFQRRSAIKTLHSYDTSWRLFRLDVSHSVSSVYFSV